MSSGSILRISVVFPVIGYLNTLPMTACLLHSNAMKLNFV